jgi:hypothetical protein
MGGSEVRRQAVLNRFNVISVLQLLVVYNSAVQFGHFEVK